MFNYFIINNIYLFLIKVEIKVLVDYVIPLVLDFEQID